MAIPDQENSTARWRVALDRLVTPDEDWSRDPKRAWSSRAVPLAVSLLTVLGGGALLLAVAPSEIGTWRPIALALVVAGIGLALLLLREIRMHLITPLTALRRWALEMCHGGDMKARIPDPPQDGEFRRLAFRINRLSDALQRLANDMDAVVQVQTDRLQQKNRSMEILYEVASAVNTSSALRDVLQLAARKLMDVVDGKAASVRLLAEDGSMQLVETIGLDAAAELPHAGNAFSEIEALADGHVRTLDDVVIAAEAAEERPFGVIAVPLRYQGKNLGVVSVFTATPATAETPEIRRLLISVGEHLGMAIEKSRLDEESQKLSIMRERTTLAHELHDSLAQTLASLRFQANMLSETVSAKDLTSALREVERLRNSLNEAHAELRELLANFRAPIHKRGLLRALDHVAVRFREETGIAAFFQSDQHEVNLPAEKELQVLRIVGEALANARKHSGAHTVRILLSHENQGRCRILIEDDGRGFSDTLLDGHPGEHIGLTIMQERARRLGGEVRVESEPGEGTRVELEFPLQAVIRLERIKAGAA